MTAVAPDLRPLTLGEILDRAVRLYRRNFANFIGIIALVQVPLSIIQLLLTVYNANKMVSVPSQFHLVPANIGKPGQFWVLRSVRGFSSC